MTPAAPPLRHRLTQTSRVSPQETTTDPARRGAASSSRGWSRVFRAAAMLLCLSTALACGTPTEGRKTTTTSARPSASPPPRAPVGPSVYAVTSGFELIRFDRDKAYAVESDLSVASALAAKEGGVFFTASGKDTSLGVRREKGQLIEKYKPGGPPHLYYYDGATTKRAKVPELRLELVSQLDNGWLVAKKRNAIGLFDVKTWWVRKTSEIAKELGLAAGGQIKEVFPLRGGRLALIFSGYRDGGTYIGDVALGDDVASVQWNATRFVFPEGERFKTAVSTSLLELDDGRYLRMNQSLFKRNGDGFDRVATPFKLHDLPLAQSNGMLLAAADDSAVYVLKDNEFRLIKRYPKGDKIAAVHQGDRGLPLLVVKHAGMGNTIDVVEADGSVRSLLSEGEDIGSDTQVVVDPKGRIWTSVIGGSAGHVVENGATTQKYTETLDFLTFAGGGLEALPASIDATVGALAER
ncbi:MAG: hypothetical protein AAGN82_02165 [Myxococcota bacterium]